MKTTNLLLLCGSALPLFAGCGGCGSPSVAQQQAMRGSWGVEEDEPTPPPTPPAVPVAEAAVAAVDTSPLPEPAAAVPAVADAAASDSLAATPATMPAPTAPQPVAVDSNLTTPAVPPSAALADSDRSPASIPVAASIRSPASTLPAPEAAVATAASSAAADEAERVVASTPSGDPGDPTEPTEPTEPQRGETEIPIASVVSQVASEASGQTRESGLSLLGKAEALAVAGKETEADRMLLGEAMLRDRLEEWPFVMRWSPALRRPVPWIRAGVAFYVSATDVRGGVAPIPARNRALERDFGPMGRDVLELGGELAERSLARYLTLLRAGSLGPTPAPYATGPIDAARALPTRLCGGLVLFGPGEARLVKAHAERLGLDLLVVYDVRARRNVDDPEQPINDTSLKIVDVVNDRDIFETESLRNLEVQESRKNPVAADPVDSVAGEIEKFMGEALPLTDFPVEVRPENVRARLPRLIDQALAAKNALPYLVEIKALYLHGYLAGMEARDAYVAILGAPAGEALHSGTSEERILALERLLPES